jgi:hypothetical protein
MSFLIQGLLDWLKSLFWKQEMEVTLVGKCIESDSLPHLDMNQRTPFQLQTYIIIFKGQISFSQCISPWF